jgi:uncharacterized protein (TIGR02444 family)
MTRELAAEGFWRFSLMVYSRPGVAGSLIGLQDRSGHNVNLMLFGLWLGLCAARRLDAAGLACAKTAIRSIDRDVVAPLRQLRRALKADRDPDIRALQQRLLALEIAAERRAQARLAASVRPGAALGDSRNALAEGNLRLILGDEFESEEGVLLRRTIAAL